MSKEKIKDLHDRLETNKRVLSELRFPENLATEGTGNIMRISISLPSGSKYLGNGQYRPSVDPATGATETSLYRTEGSSSIKRRFSKNYVRTLTHIDLYMPPKIGTSYSSDWGSTELGIVGSAIDAGYGLASINSMEGAKEAWEIVKRTVPQALWNSISGVLQTLTPFNVEGARKAIQSTITNPYVEVLFNGIRNREFSFTFKMIPKNKREQEILKRIIYELKFHSAPELKWEGQSNYWLFPSEFDIQFLTRDNSENQWIFKISTCALTNFSVDYTPEGNFAAHEGGAPFAVEMTMNFMEMEQITKDRIKSGGF